MIANDWTQKRLATACSVNQSSVSLWLRERARPSASKRTLIRQISGIEESSWLLAKERRAVQAALRRLAKDASPSLPTEVA